MNDREFASVIWLGVVLLAGAKSADIRAAYSQVAKSFVHSKVVGPILALAGWTVGLAALAHSVDLWRGYLLSDTVVWFVTVGIAFYFSLGNVAEDGFFRRTARRAVGVAVFVEVFVNLRVFSLAVELVLVPFVSIVAMLAAFSEANDEYRATHRLANFVLFVLAMVFAVYVTASLLGDPRAGETLRKLLLPLWLTVGVMPLIYAIGLWSAFEQAFLRINFATDDRTSRRRAKGALLRVANFRAPDVGGFSGHWIHDLASAESSQAARHVMQQFRASWRSERHAERTNNARTNMRLWLNETDPTLADLHEDALRRSWDRLDAEQRATLKSEALRLPTITGARLDVVRMLPN